MNIIVDKNRPELESAIGGHIRLLVKDLCRKQVILDDECDDITEHSSSKDRADALLKLLDAKQNIKRNVFEKLYRSCLQCELWTAADILNPDQKPHKPVDEDDSDDELFPKGTEIQQRLASFLASQRMKKYINQQVDRCVYKYMQYVFKKQEKNDDLSEEDHPDLPAITNASASSHFEKDRQLPLNLPVKKAKRSPSCFTQSSLEIWTKEAEKEQDVDEDKSFLMSLLPSLKRLEEDKKMETKIELMKVMKRAHQPTSASTP